MSIPRNARKEFAGKMTRSDFLSERGVKCSPFSSDKENEELDASQVDQRMKVAQKAL